MKLQLKLNTSIGINSVIYKDTTAIVMYAIAPEKEVSEIKKLLEEPKLHPLRENDVSAGSLNCSNMNVEKEVKLDSIKASALMFVSNLASSKTGNILEQYFILDRMDENGFEKTEEAFKEDIKKIFFKKNMKALPIPIKKEWEEYFWEEVSKNIKRLPEKGNPPMVGYIMSLPDLNYLERLIEKCHAKYEFKQYKGRIPKLSALLTIADIKNFDLGLWKSYFTNLGGKEVLESYPEVHQDTIVRGFELFGDTPLIEKNITSLHSSSLKPLTINIRLMKDEGKKRQYKTALRKILEEFSEKRSDLISILNNFDDLFKEHAQNIRNGNWKAIEKYLATIIYDNVSDGCRELALACGKVSVSKQQYPLYEEAYLENIQNCLTAPKEYPTIEGKVGKISWETIDMSDPRAWVVGIETYCCQHLGSVGGACVRYAAENPSTSGIFRVEEKGKTIAQSFFWLAESSKRGEYILVFDNIEVAGENIRESVLDAYRDFAKEMEKYSELFRIRAITIGTGYLEGFLLKLAPEDAKGENYASIPRNLNYSDAHTQKLFKTFKLKAVPKA